MATAAEETTASVAPPMDSSPSSSKPVKDAAKKSDDQSNTTAPTSASDRSEDGSNEELSTSSSCTSNGRDRRGAAERRHKQKENPGIPPSPGLSEATRRRLSLRARGGEGGPAAPFSGDSSVSSFRSERCPRSPMLRNQDADYQARRDRRLQERRSRRPSANTAAAGKETPRESSRANSKDVVPNKENNTPDAKKEHLEKKTTTAVAAVDKEEAPKIEVKENEETTKKESPADTTTSVATADDQATSKTTQADGPTPTQNDKEDPSSLDVGSFHFKDMIMPPPLTPGTPKESLGDSVAKLNELRASKTERESQLRHLITTSPATVAKTPVVPKKPLLEPVVYKDMKEELVHAYEVIELQKQHLRDQWKDCAALSPRLTDESDNDSNKLVELQGMVHQMEQERAYSELEHQRRMTELSQEYKTTIDHWKRETECWKDRFHSSWADHEKLIHQLQQEKQQLEQRAKKSEKELASIREESDTSVLELIKAKAKIRDLEQQLGIESEGKIFDEEAHFLLHLAKKRLSADAADESNSTEDEVVEEEKENPEDIHEVFEEDAPPPLQATFLQDAMKKKEPARTGILGRFAWGLSTS